MFVFGSQLYFPIFLFFSSFCLEKTYLCVFENNLIFEICICLLSRFFFLVSVFIPSKGFLSLFFFLTPSPGIRPTDEGATGLEGHRTTGPKDHNTMDLQTAQRTTRPQDQRHLNVVSKGFIFSRKRDFFHGMHLFFNVIPVFAMRSEIQMSSFKNGDTKS